MFWLLCRMVLRGACCVLCAAENTRAEDIHSHQHLILCICIVTMHLRPESRPVLLGTHCLVAFDDLPVPEAHITVTSSDQGAKMGPS